MWDEDSSAGKYVRDNCKTLQVSVNLEDLGEQYETPQIVEFQAKKVKIKLVNIIGLSILYQ